MKLSSVKAVLTAADIMEIIEEYVQVEGLVISNIVLSDIITVSGSYKKGVEIPFKAQIGLGNIYENNINIKIFSIKISKLGIFTPIKNFALKKILSDFSDNGIFIDKDVVTLDLNLISKVIPYVYFKLKSLKSIDNAIEAEVEDLIYAPAKEVTSLKRNKKEERKAIDKISDNYAKLRENTAEKVPDKYKNIVEYAMIIPDIVALLWRLFRDKRVRIDTKILIGGAIAYLASPIDIIPDFIPMIGKIDDVAIAFFVMNKLINEIDEKIILENWNGKENIIEIIKNGVAYISKMVGSENVGKLVDFIKKLGKKNVSEEKEYEECNDIH